MATPSDDILNLLTAYALDALEPEEMVRVNELLEQDPTLHAILAELRSTTNCLPYGLAESEPPPELRQKVLDHAVGRSRRIQAPALPSRRGFGMWLAGLGGLAALAVVVAVLGWAEVGMVSAELAQTKAALDAQVAQNEQVAAVISSGPEAVALSGTGGSGTVLRNANGQLVLAADLPPSAQDRVYQFWLIGDEGTPVSGGTFTVAADGKGLVALPENVLASNALFAVTDEPGPDGSEQPTSDILISNLPTT